MLTSTGPSIAIAPPFARWRRAATVEIEVHLDRVAPELIFVVLQDEANRVAQIEGRFRLPLLAGKFVEGRHSLLKGV